MRSAGFRVSEAGMPGLAGDAWRVHARATSSPAGIRVTRPSAPILYFGDLEAYRASPRRIVTVGVNPSGEEFPAGSPWSRFDCAEIAASETLDADAIDRYLGVLNAYFGRDPYNRWFERSYEHVLRGLSASYYGGGLNTALHTDVCSPLATTPTWRFLKKAEQGVLATDGVPLWHRLVAELEPHMILASVSAPHFSRINLEQLSPPEVIYSVAQKRNYDVTVRRVRCGNGESRLVWAGASTTPFQPITDSHKRAVGAALASVLDQ